MGEDNAEKDLPGSLSEAFASEPMGTAEEYGRQINMLCYEDGYIVIFGGIPFSFATRAHTAATSSPIMPTMQVE